MPVTIQPATLRYKNGDGQFQTADCIKGDIGDPSIIIDDTSGSGDTGKVWSADKVSSELDGKLNSTLKGAANGIAELDQTGKVPSSQLPSYVDDVLEYADFASFPQEGESGKIYVALDTNKTYRWGGSAYAEISESLALGETSTTAYRGDRGKVAYEHATDSGKIANAQVAGLYKIAVTAEGHIASVSAVTASDIIALGIIDDTAGDGDTNKVWSADKSADLMSAITQKQDAPATAGTSGQVLGLNAQLEPEWKTVSGGGIVDSSLSEISENPVQNKVITNKIGQIVQDVHDPSTNFINYNDVGLGYIKSNGEAQTSGNWHNTGYVELEPGETYYWSGLYGSSAGYYAFYNSSKTAIYVGTSNLPNPFVPPAGTKYGRFSKNGDITSGVWISLTNSAPSNYGTMLDSSLLQRKNIGTKYAGKALKVGSDGIITPSETETVEAELWRKGNLYKESELVAGKYIYKTGNENSYSGYYCTPFLPVSGDYVYVQSQILGTYYAFYNATKTLVASYDTLGDMTQWTPGIRRVAIPSGAVYGRFSSNGLPASYAFISCVAENPPATDQMAVKDVFPSTSNPANPCDYESGSIGVFHKIVCIGDSLTSGVMNYDDGNLIDTPSSSTLAEWYSYPTQLTKMTGVQTTNMGDASETFKSWYELYGNTDFSGHDCAIIMLGVNDASFDKTDEETEEYLCAIIDALKASVMNIKIFVCTITPVFSNDRFPTHKHKSQVIRDTLTDHYASDPNVILFDIEQYSHVTQYTSYAAGHFTAIGYWRFAKDVANFISWHIDNHLRDYRFVQFIGSDRTYTGD